jgi:hypothetical protein
MKMMEFITVLKINIGTGMTSGEIALGSTSSLTKTTNIATDTTLDIQNSGLTGQGNVNVACGASRLGSVAIGVNTNTSIGQTVGSVNIMNGTGRQEGSFNVLTNSANRGTINLGSTGLFEGGIHIYAALKSGLKLSYSAITGDTFMGSYKRENYQRLTSMTLNNTEQRIIGSIPTLMSIGIYQLNFNAGIVVNKNHPQLSTGVYLKVGTPAWTNGNLRGATGTLDSYLFINNHYYTGGSGGALSLSLSGLLIIGTKSYVACVVGNTDNDTMNITSADTYLSLVRVG